MYKYEEPEFRFFQVNKSDYSIRIGKSLITQNFTPSGSLLPISKGLSLGQKQIQPYSFWAEHPGDYLINAGTKFIEIFPKSRHASAHREGEITKGFILDDLRSVSSNNYLTACFEYNETNLNLSETNLIAIEPHSDIIGHTHPVAVAILVIEGRYFLTSEDKCESTFYPGDIIHIKPDVFHTVRSEEPVKAIEFWQGIDFWE